MKFYFTISVFQVSRRVQIMGVVTYDSLTMMIFILLGLDAPSNDLQNENRREQIRKIQQMEDKQLRILFGVCILFVVCHTCRIYRHFEELYQKSTNMDIFRSCNEGCASPYSLSSHVSITYEIDFHRFNVVEIYIYQIMLFRYDCTK